MHWRIDIKRFILLLLALSLAVLAIRGCIFARKCGGKTCDDCDSDCLITEPIDKTEKIYIDVFEHNSGKRLHMELEDYIGHVVAAEMPASFKNEALKAQAVAATHDALWRDGLFERLRRLHRQHLLPGIPKRRLDALTLGRRL